MALQVTRRTMIASNNEHCWVELFNAWQNPVELFDLLYLFGKVTIFARAVGVLEVDEEEIVVLPVLLESVDLL